MNYDLITLVSKLRHVENMEQLNDVKDLAETFMRKEKNSAILTLMAVAEELGSDEILSSVDQLREYLNSVIRK